MGNLETNSKPTLDISYRNDGRGQREGLVKNVSNVSSHVREVDRILALLLQHYSPFLSHTLIAIADHSRDTLSCAPTDEIPVHSMPTCKQWIEQSLRARNNDDAGMLRDRYSKLTQLTPCSLPILS